MTAIFLKEINAFFSGMIGYLVIAVFLLVTGLFLWVFDGGFNILTYGFADLSGLFQLAPWVFLFLIPAVTMRSFSEEKKQGTLELLLTRPLTKWQLIWGKFLGNATISVLALLPTILYVITLYNLRKDTEQIDGGQIIGSYLGLLLLVLVFTSVGIFSSSLFKNQIASFILSALLTLSVFYGFEGLSQLALFEHSADLIQYLGISFHYQSIQRGVLDTRDLLYFLSLITLFLTLTHFNLSRYKA